MKDLLPVLLVILALTVIGGAIFGLWLIGREAVMVLSGVFVGGFVASFLGLGSFTGFNFGSFLIATGGAILILVLYRAAKR